VLDTHVASEQGKGYIKLKNFKICHPNAQVTVRGIKILIDGEEDNYATLKEMIFEACHQELNPETILFSARNKAITSQSQIQVSVDSVELQELPPTSCKHSQQYNEVIAPMIQSSCLECHNKNNSPLTCDSLIDTYQQSGPFNHHAYFVSGRSHPKIGTTLQTEVLTQYLKLESTGDNSLIQKFTQAFDKIKNLIHSKKSENIDINPVTLITGASSSISCALFNDGTGKCWGDNRLGQTGNDKRGDAILVQEAQALPFRNIQQIAVGGRHTCALFNDGTAKCWGDNGYGQTGNDQTDGLILAKDSQTLPFRNIQQIVAGMYHTCALFNDGTGKCWGNNWYDQTGNNNRYSKTLLHESQALPFNNIQQIVAGSAHTCALFSDGTGKCWGKNEYGQAGNDKTYNLILAKDSQAVPFRNIQQIVTGSFHTCAVLEFGQIKCWGENSNGQLGYSDTKNRFQPDIDDVPFFPLLELFK